MGKNEELIELDARQRLGWKLRDAFEHLVRRVSCEPTIDSAGPGEEWSKLRADLFLDSHGKPSSPSSMSTFRDAVLWDATTGGGGPSRVMNYGPEAFGGR